MNEASWPPAVSRTVSMSKASGVPDMLRTLFYSIDLWLRQRLGLGPRRKFVSIYYRISDSAWL